MKISLLFGIKSSLYHTITKAKAMKTLKKALFWILGILATVLLLAVAVVYYLETRALPDYNEDVKISGLRSEVRVYRDERAVPHVFAQNEHDLYMVTGYLMAQDRLWQMDLLRRVTQGRLSEIFGADMVDTDQLLRALQIQEKSKMVLENSDQALLDCLSAFADGVNAYLEQAGKRLPIEFTVLGYKPEKWESLHSLNLIGYMAWDLAGSWEDEIALHKLRGKVSHEMLMELYPHLDMQTSYVFDSVKTTILSFNLLDAAENLHKLGVEGFSASNNWAVTASKSANGKALMANDMHLGFGLPGIWYQIHQEVEGSFRVSGVALPGAPIVVAGHNEFFAWGMTNLYVDEMDFYLENLHPEDSTLYLFNGEWRPLKIQQEEIKIKGGEAVMRSNAFTHRGPLISGFREVKAEQISMRWTGNELSNELRSMYLINKARNWDEFRNALTTMGAVSQNVIYADVEGNIGLQTAGMIPVRKQGKGMFVYPGDTDAYDWSGFLPFEELPYAYNPPENQVSSANNRTTGPDYPYHIGHWYATPARIDRIRQMINEKPQLDVEDFKRMQADFTSSFAATYTPELLEIVSRKSDLNPLESQALNNLKNWNYNLTADCKATPVFEFFFMTFMKNALSDELGDTLFRSLASGIMRHGFLYLWENRSSAWIDNVNTAETETFEDLVVKSFADAVQQLSTQYGDNPDKWKWGEMHQLTLRHPMGGVKILDRIFGLNKGPFPVGGSFHTVNPMAFGFHKPFSVRHGASQRHIYMPSDWNNSYTVIPTGTSGIPASKYYGSQAESFLSHQYHKESWTRADIESRAKHQCTFKP